MPKIIRNTLIGILVAVTAFLWALVVWKFYVHLSPVNQVLQAPHHQRPEQRAGPLYFTGCQE